jgi:anti-sigma factor RsiW
MSKCPSDEKLAAYFDGELPEAEAGAVEAHVRSCQACAGELAELRELQELTSSMAAPQVSSEEWLANWSAIVARIAPSQAPAARGAGRVWEALRRFRLALAPAAAAALVALAVGLWALRSPETAPPVQAVVEEIEPAAGYTANCFYSSEADVTIITVLPADMQEIGTDDEGEKPL